MKRRGSQEQITHSLKKHNLNFTSSATIMSLKSFEHGNNGGMTQLMFVKDHLGYCMDNGLEETVQQGDNGRG